MNLTLPQEVVFKAKDKEKFLAANPQLVKPGVGPQAFFIKEKVARKETILSIKCGMHHTILLTDKGLLYGFGDNSYNQLESGK
jgi:alpha-tubulin suppressor-like RCC1 family protein